MAETAADKEGRNARNTYHPGFDRRAADYCMLGATNEQLAELFGVSVSAIQKWLVERPSFARAVRRGRVEANVRVVKALHRAATGYSHRETKVLTVGGAVKKVDVTKRFPPNVNAAALILTNRDPDRWRDRKVVDLSHTIDLASIVEASLGAAGKALEVQAEVVDDDEPDVK